MRESWTDDRLDDFRAETARRFDSVESRFDRLEGRTEARFDHMEARFDHMDARFDNMEARFDAMQRAIMQGAIALSGAFIAGFAALAVLIGA